MIRDNTYRVLQLVDHDAQFEKNVNMGVEPVILNLFNMQTPADMDHLKNQVYGDGGNEDFVAKCQCGELEGNNKLGMLCPICDTKVSPISLLDSDNLICKSWLAAPTELVNGWLSPKIYLAMTQWLSYEKGKKNKRNYLDDILDVDAELPFELTDVIQGRGFAYLYDNFDRIVEYFVYNHPVVSKKTDTPAMRVCLELYRNQVFCKYIPIMNAAISPMFSTDGVGVHQRKYSDPTADYVLQAAISLSQLENENRKKNRSIKVERVAYKAYRDIIMYVEEATSKYISVKKAIPRMHIFGSRFHWSFRAVVVPIVGPHQYDELHIPWQMAVNTFRVHLHGALLRQGYSINEAVSKVRRALNNVDEDIRLILNKLIEDSPYIGIPCLWDRPPSIRDGSVLLKFITKIKPDLDDSCVAITPVDHSLQNVDFDGDALAGVIVPETDMVDKMRGMSPSAQIYDRNSVGITDEIAIHKTLSITWNSFLGLV